MSNMVSSRWLPSTTLALLLCAGPAHAQGPLPLGAPATGTTSDGAPAEYVITIDAAGVLTVAVHGNGDLALDLVDEDGQTVPNGSADGDLNGSLGTEVLATTIPNPGTYRLRVRKLDGGRASFDMSAAFLAFPALERPADPDRRPGLAQPIDIGQGHEDSLDAAAGDLVDWFVLTPTDAGTLTIITQAPGSDSTDLVLEAFLDGDFGDPVDRSDQDRQDNTANEAVTVTVSAGQKVHIRVSGAFDSVSGAYRVSSSLIRAPESR